MLRPGISGPLSVAVPFVVTIVVAAASFYLLGTADPESEREAERADHCCANVAPGITRVTY